MDLFRKSIVWKLVLPIPIILCLSLVFVWLFLDQKILEVVRTDAKLDAELLLRTLQNQRRDSAETLRQKRIDMATQQPGDINYPVPTDMLHTLNDKSTDDNLVINVISNHPFANRQGRLLDDFERRALKTLSERPAVILRESETRGAQEFIRIAIADRMTSKACVTCHNQVSGSPKTDWKIGDVAGVLTVARNINDHIAGAENLRAQLQLYILAAGVLVILLSVLIGHIIARHISVITSTMHNLAKGDVVPEVPLLDRHDELGTMAKALDVFKDQSSELREFAYSTSHDLRAPLATINGLTKHMMDDLNAERYGEVARNLNRVETLSLRLSDLIERMFLLAKSDHTDERTEAVDIGKMVDSVAARLQGTYEERGVKLRINLTHKTKPVTQPDRLEQVIDNLAANGAKFFDQNKSEQWVEIFTFETDDSLVIVVEDNGVGIPLERQSVVFEPFKKFHGKNISGSGLGLTLVKKHVTRMNGDVSFRSTKEGTSFRITLPLRNQRLAA